MWGIFIAKYSPNLNEIFFGNGPYQLNNYFYSHEIRLDLPEEKLTSLFLPHSSIADLFIFTGLIGVGLICFLLSQQLQKKSDSKYLKFLVFYLLLNFLKSDSILYVSSLLLLFTSMVLIKENKSVNE
tara:strand:- start:123 stop:503 length:381 start_codon:yes stop_codon:yes gene_type:complete